MGFIKEFKEFAVKGNVIDLAVGVIIGGAFGKIVTSLIEDIVTPLILNPALKAAGVSRIEEFTMGGIYVGKFLNAVLTFIVIAFVIFWMVKGINSLKKKEEPAAAAEPSSTDKLLAEIRDELKKK